MYALCHSSTCRRVDILRYFGEKYSAINCNGCDHCLASTELVDETVVAKKILSCVYRLEQKFGIKYVIDVLRGSNHKTLLENRHDCLSTYGLMTQYSEADLRYYIDALIGMGFLERTSGTYPVLRWTATSPGVTSGTTKVVIRKKIRPIAQPDTRSAPQYDRALFQELSQLRRKWAQQTEVPAFVVFGDRSLIEMATLYPTTQKEMLAINGCGPTKWQKYGQSFLDVITDYCTKNEINPSQQVHPTKNHPSCHNPSSQETLALFLKGHLPEQIAHLRNLTLGTIINHLALEIASGTDLDISGLVSPQRQEAINQVIAVVGTETLSSIKNALPEEFTYEEIRLVTALHKRKSC